MTNIPEDAEDTVAVTVTVRLVVGDVDHVTLPLTEAVDDTVADREPLTETVAALQKPPVMLQSSRYASSLRNGSQQTST